MLNRDNAVGFVLLGVCAVVAVWMIFAIGSGERPSVSLPAPWNWLVGALFFGLVLYGFLHGPLGRRLRGGSGEAQWPDPQTGRRSWWDRLRGR